MSNSTINDFDPNEILKLRKIIAKRPGESSLIELNDEELFKALRLIVDVNGDLIPTVTGILLIGKDSVIDKLLPTAQAAFQVMDGTSVRVNEQISRPLSATFDFFTDLLKPWNPEKEVSDGLFRIPVPKFNLDAFREALINAFCHRDYTILQMTRVLIDDEGLTIIKMFLKNRN